MQSRGLPQIAVRDYWALCLRRACPGGATTDRLEGKPRLCFPFRRASAAEGGGRTAERRAHGAGYGSSLSVSARRGQAPSWRQQSPVSGNRARLFRSRVTSPMRIRINNKTLAIVLVVVGVADLVLCVLTFLWSMASGFFRKMGLPDLGEAMMVVLFAGCGIWCAGLTTLVVRAWLLDLFDRHDDSLEDTHNEALREWLVRIMRGES